MLQAIHEIQLHWARCITLISIHGKWTKTGLY